MTISILTLCHYAECRVLFIIMLNASMLKVVMLNVFMLSVAMLSVVMLSIVMLSVVAPPRKYPTRHRRHKTFFSVIVDGTK
jgi:hypothetical protein